MSRNALLIVHLMAIALGTGMSFSNFINAGLATREEGERFKALGLQRKTVSQIGDGVITIIWLTGLALVWLRWSEPGLVWSGWFYAKLAVVVVADRQPWNGPAHRRRACPDRQPGAAGASQALRRRRVAVGARCHRPGGDGVQGLNQPGRPKWPAGFCGPAVILALYIPRITRASLSVFRTPRAGRRHARPCPCCRGP